MITKLAEWYKILSIPGLSGDMLEKRATIVKKVAKAKDSAWFHECIRLFLGRKLTNDAFVAEFTTLFQENDNLFTSKDNSLELQILSGALIAELIDNSKNKEKLRIAVAAKTSAFGATLSPWQSEIVAGVETYLNDESLKNRQLEDKAPTINLAIDASVSAPSVEILTAKFTSVNEQLQKVSQYLNERNDHYTKRISVLEEESNIHWWIFRGQSETAMKPNKDLDKQSAPMVIAADMVKLSNVLPYPINYPQFLSRVFSDSDINLNDSTSVKLAINAFLPYFKSLENSEGAEKLSSICPLLFGCVLAEKAGDPEGWSAFYKSSLGFETSSEHTYISFASQMFLEATLLKSKQ